MEGERRRKPLKPPASNSVSLMSPGAKMLGNFPKAPRAHPGALFGGRACPCRLPNCAARKIIPCYIYVILSYILFYIILTKVVRSAGGGLWPRLPRSSTGCVDLGTCAVAGELRLVKVPGAALQAHLGACVEKPSLSSRWCRWPASSRQTSRAQPYRATSLSMARSQRLCASREL